MDDTMRETVSGACPWLCLTDRTLRVLFASPRASAWLGSSSVMGIRLSLVVPELAEAVLSAAKDDFPIRCVIGGLFPAQQAIALNIYPLRGEVEGFLCCEERESLSIRPNTAGFSLDSIESAMRWSVLGSVVPGYVHDVNNVLTGMFGHIALLKAAFSSDNAALESLSAIESGARKAGFMTRALDSIGREEEVAPSEPSEAHAALRQICALLAHIAPPSVTVVSDIPTYPFSGLSSAVVVGRSVLPFALSCMHSVERPSRLTITAEEVSVTGGVKWRDSQVQGVGDSLQIVIRAAPLAVDDRNPSTVLPKTCSEPSLFRLYSAAIEEAGGTFCSDMFSDGSITGRITLPFRSSFRNEANFEENEQVSRLPDARSTEALPRGCERILVMDDEESIRDVIVRSLEQLGYQVTAVASGRAALKAFQSPDAGFDLVLLDMILPDVSGSEVFGRIREIQPDAPILVMSGYSPAGRVQDLLAAGRSSFIQKPFTISDLAFRVRACLAPWRDSSLKMNR